MKRRAALALLLCCWVPLFLVAAEEPTGAPAAEGHAAEGEERAKGDGLTTAFKWINFLTFFGALAFLLWKPLKQTFAEERAAIRGAIDDARAARADAERRLAEVEQRLAGLTSELARMRQDAQREAAAERQRAAEVARREAERLAAGTKAEIESARKGAQMELRAYVARLAVELAEKRLVALLTPAAHGGLIQAFADRLGEKR